MNLRLEYYNIYEIPDKEKIYNEPNILSSGCFTYLYALTEI